MGGGKGLRGGGIRTKGGSHPECTVIVSLIGPVISELRVGVCIIRHVNQSNKKVYLFGFTFHLLCFFVVFFQNFYAVWKSIGFDLDYFWI